MKLLLCTLPRCLSAGVANGVRHSKAEPPPALLPCAGYWHDTATAHTVSVAGNVYMQMEIYF